MGLRPIVLAVVVAASLAWAADGRADAAADLEKAHNAYVAKQYGEAESRLRALLDPSSEMKDPDMIAEARMYLGAVLLAEGKKEEANAIFETLLLEKKGNYEPDPLRVSLEAINALTDARARVRAQIKAIQDAEIKKAQEDKAKAEAQRLKEAARVAMLEKLAGTETVTHESSRWVALVPFGVGQFQNRSTALGWLFLGTEVALTIGTVVATGIENYNYNRSLQLVSTSRSDAQQYHDRAEIAWVYKLSFGGGLLLTAIGGIVQAQLAYLPSYTEVKPRPIPSVAVSPVVAPQSGGALFGLQARF
jgi:hypothetical protein